MLATRKGLTIEVIAHVGPPHEVDGTWRCDEVISTADVHGVVDDPYGPGDEVDNVISMFQDAYACKVAYLEDATQRRRFDIFEPSWVDQRTAQQVAGVLVDRLVKLTCGHSNGQ